MQLIGMQNMVKVIFKILYIFLIQQRMPRLRWIHEWLAAAVNLAIYNMRLITEDRTGKYF